ncbi:hypothetical protein [Marinovum sp.]|uniref:hypothetical protein n=1 Tax=Marinovum sp. TaxID=2024839 RepID=UPI002B2754F8|nr:hypothetical protein [Marinovum sp.]
MKLGYLSIPPAAGSGRPAGGYAADNRARLAEALGFSEFYAARCDTGSGPLVLEDQPLLHILPDTPARRLPHLVVVGDDSPRRTGPLAAPTACADAVRAGSARGHAPFSVSWLDSDMLARHWAAHVTGCTHSGRCARAQDWRVARTVIVDPDAARAEALAKAPGSPCRDYYRKTLPAGACDTALEALIDACVLFGSPGDVMARIAALTEVSASFGTLTLIDHAWPDAARARRSMMLFAEAMLDSHHSLTQRKVRKLELA